MKLSRGNALTSGLLAIVYAVVLVVAGTSARPQPAVAEQGKYHCDCAGEQCGQYVYYKWCCYGESNCGCSWFLVC